MLVLAVIGLFLTGAAPDSGPADTSLRVPGTTLRFGITDAALSARGFAGAGAGARHGPCRFFGLPSEASLDFEEGRLARAAFTVDDASPHQIAYVQDQLTVMGYKRRCAKLVPRASVCDWTGPVLVHLEVSGAKLTARVERRGASATTASNAPAPQPHPERSAAEKALAVIRGAGGGTATPGEPTPARADTTAPARHDSLPAPGATPPAHADTAAAARPSIPPRAGLSARDRDTLAVALLNRPSRYPPAKVEFAAPCAYPEAARKAGIQGRVWVFALVDTAGRVLEAHLERGIPELNAAALECVRRWRFAARSSAEPSPEFSGPVSYWVQVPITFTLH